MIQTLKNASIPVTDKPLRIPRVDVLCVTYGEPPDNSWWPQFQYSLNILNRLTRRIAPIPRAVTPLLAARRAWIRSRQFRHERWCSPLESISQRQAIMIEKELSLLDPTRRYRVHVVFEFRPPFIWNLLAAAEANPPDEIIVVPMYVSDGDFTSGVSRRDIATFQAERSKRCPLPSPKYVEGFGYDKRSGNVMAKFIWEQCVQAGWDLGKCRDSVLILGAHGTLIRPPAGMNAGAHETRYLFGSVRSHLRERFRSIRLGWLNHKFGGEWTFPAVTESAAESQRTGIRNVVYFPFGFVADNGESQLEGKRQLAEFTWNDMLYLPCLNDNQDFIHLTALRVLERLGYV